MTLSIIIFLLLLIFIIAISAGGAKTSETYWLNNRSTSKALIAASVSSSLVGAGSLFGVAAAGYGGGNAGVILGLANSLGVVLFGIFLAPKIWKLAGEGGFSSIGEFLESRVDPGIAKLSSFFLGLGYFFITAAQFSALFLIVSTATGLDQYTSVIISFLIVMGYTYFGGIRADIRTDIFQLALITVCFPVIFINLFSRDSELASKYMELPIEYLTGTAYQGVEFLIAALVLVPLTVVVSVELWQRAMSAESAKAGSVSV